MNVLIVIRKFLVCGFLVCTGISIMVLGDDRTKIQANRQWIDYLPLQVDYLELSLEVRQVADYQLKRGDTKRAELGYKWILANLPESPKTKLLRRQVQQNLKATLKKE